MKTDYDAIIVGGGHNGLTCGAYLSKAGLKTLVLERRHIIGGAAVTEEFSPGFRASTFSYIMGHVNPKVIADLELEKFGLQHISIGAVVHPLHDDCIVFSTDTQVTQEQIARFSKKDARAYPQFFDDMKKTISVLRKVLLETPIDPSDRSIRSLKDMTLMGWRYRDVKNELYQIIDAMTMSAYDYVSRWFESEQVKAMFCYWAGIGNFVGPKTSGTAYSILFHLLGENPLGFSRGGMGQISNAIAASGQNHGMEIITDAAVEEIIVSNDCATGVTTQDGRQFNARIVASNVAAPLTFGKLVSPKYLPDEFLNDISHYRCKGNSFKINIAVDRLPQYKHFVPGSGNVEYPCYGHIGPTIEYMEQAYDDSKFGWYSTRPFISPIVPSYVDDSLAPEGKHVVMLCGGYAPYELKHSDWSTEKDNLVNNVLKVMDEFTPGFSESVLDMQVFVPPDLEDVLGMPGGHELHGDVSLDQLFFKRPVPHYADYRSPIKNLYQCGASTHPGGAVSAVPGHNSAREILKDWRKL